METVKRSVVPGERGGREGSETTLFDTIVLDTVAIPLSVEGRTQRVKQC